MNELHQFRAARFIAVGESVAIGPDGRAVPDRNMAVGVATNDAHAGDVVHVRVDAARAVPKKSAVDLLGEAVNGSP